MMKKFIKLAMCICLFFGLSSYSYSKIIIAPVDYPTITECVWASCPGDIVYVMPGIYEETFCLADGVRLIGTNSKNCIIDGKELDVSLIEVRDNNMISGFTFRRASRGITSWGGSNIQVIGNIFENFFHFKQIIGIFDSSYISIFGNIVRNCFGGGECGISINFSSKAIVRNNLVYKNYRGLMICSSEADVLFNTIWHHDIGIQSQEFNVMIPNDATIKNNIITNNEYEYGHGATLCNIYGVPPVLNPLKISFNDVWNPIWGWNYSYCQPIEGDIHVDPQFVDPENEDFHLKETSPCLTASSEGGEIGAYGNGGMPGVGIKLPLLQQMEVIIRVTDYLTEDCFKKPNNKRVLINRFEIIERNLQRAESSKGSRGSYQSSLNIAKNSILPRTNGCETSGNPDENDWITDCEAQKWIYSLLLNLIETLEKKLQ